MKFKVNEVSIGEALKCIESHVYSLPSIQRPFQWSKEKIQNLITSVIEGYPLNMMTFMHFNYDETSPNQLAHSYSFIDRYVTRDYLPDPEWEGKGMHRAPKEDRAKEVKYWVFDGQQRLTSLNIAFRGSYAVCKKGGWGYIIKNYVPECLFVKLGNKNDKGRNDSNIDSESPLII